MGASQLFTEAPTTHPDGVFIGAERDLACVSFPGSVALQPGAYNARAPAGRRRFRRHHDPNVDGPFFLDQVGAWPSSPNLLASRGLYKRTWQGGLILWFGSKGPGTRPAHSCTSVSQMPDGTSTRVKEISSLIRAPGDSGLGPGEYDGLLNKDAVMRSAPAVKVGQRGGSTGPEERRDMGGRREEDYGSLPLCVMDGVTGVPYGQEVRL